MKEKTGVKSPFPFYGVPCSFFLFQISKARGRNETPILGYLYLSVERRQAMIGSKRNVSFEDQDSYCSSNRTFTMWQDLTCVSFFQKTKKTLKEHVQRTILQTCDICENFEISDNWEPQNITIILTWQKVALDKIHNFCKLIVYIYFLNKTNAYLKSRALLGLISCWRPFGLLDFVHGALRALRRRATHRNTVRSFGEIQKNHPEIQKKSPGICFWEKIGFFVKQ